MSRRVAGEAGAMTVYFVTAVFAVIPLIGLVVDGVGIIRAQQAADLVALETARTAGQELELGQAIKGAYVRVDPGRANQAATRYAAEQEGYQVSEVQVSPDGYTLTVTTLSSYQPVLLSAIGIGPREIHGEGTAYLHRTDKNGNEYDHDPDSF